MIGSPSEDSSYLFIMLKKANAPAQRQTQAWVYGWVELLSIFHTTHCPFLCIIMALFLHWWNLNPWVSFVSVQPRMRSLHSTQSMRNKKKKPKPSCVLKCAQKERSVHTYTPRGQLWNSLAVPHLLPIPFIACLPYLVVRRIHTQTTWNCKVLSRTQIPWVAGVGWASWASRPGCRWGAQCPLCTPTVRGRRVPGKQTCPRCVQPCAGERPQNNPCSVWWSLQHSPAREW